MWLKQRSAARVYITGAENISAIAVENTKARTRVSPEMSLVPGRFQMIFPLKMDLNRSPYYVCSRPFTEIYVLSELLSKLTTLSESQSRHGCRRVDTR